MSLGEHHFKDTYTYEHTYTFNSKEVLGLIWKIFFFDICVGIVILKQVNCRIEQMSNYLGTIMNQCFHGGKKREF
jgi:hypothetical protein